MGIVQQKGDDLKKSASPAHLLWALLFLKSYCHEKYLASMLGVQPKTVRKWVWYFLNAVADLAEYVVSTITQILLHWLLQIYYHSVCALTTCACCCFLNF
jgi:hypothetical protein